MSQDHEPGNGATDNPEGAPARASSGVDTDIDFRTAQAERQGRRRAVRRSRDLTKGSVPKNLWFLAWPQMVEGVFNSLDQMVDLFWAGRVIGFRAIGGIGVAQAYAHLVMMARTGLDIAMQAMISRAVGAGRMDTANHIALQGLTVTIILSSVLAVAGVLAAKPLLDLLALSDEVIAVTIVYLQYQFAGSAVQGWRKSAEATLQAAGDVLTPMKATLLARSLHIVITPFLIFGWFGAPEMGIAGAAAANIIAQAVGFVWNMYALFAGSAPLRLTLRGYRLDVPLMGRMLKIGLPASGTQLERGLSELMLVRLVAPFGDIALAAYALTRRLERLTHIGSMGMGRASGILVGQNLGAGSIERAKSTVRWAVGYVLAIRGLAGIVLLLAPAFFILIFNQDPAFLVVAIIWIRIQAVSGMLLGGGQVLQQSFNVAGDTMAPLLITFMSMWVLEVPAAFLLSQFTPLGQYGIPVAIGLAMFLRLGLYALYYRTGRWTRVKVF
ncbi:MAG: MATE family efflux transporter [Chloroflexi bacterium]|nr:MATE family efflux transporter [Chloroflexota bacterium]